MAFPGATADRAEAAYVVVGAPLDVSTSFQPGTRFGPDRIRTLAEPFDDHDRRTGQEFSGLGVADGGDVRAWDDPVEYLDYLEGELAAVVRDDAVPLVLGGEHTVSVAGARAVAPDVYVCLDAHLDLRDDFDGNRWSHACTTRRVLETADEAVLLDLRPESQYERWHGPEAMHVPFETALEQYSMLPREPTWVLYCEVGLKSALIAEKMNQHGFDAYSFRGGVPKLRKWLDRHDKVDGR
jgi:agmatinase